MTLKEVQNNLKQVVVDKFRELNQIRNEIISECGEWADKKPDEYNFPIEDFSENVLFIKSLSEDGIKWYILGKSSKTISLDYFEKDYNTLKRWFLQDLQDEYTHRLRVVVENYNYHKKFLENVDEDCNHHKECMENANDVRKIFEDKLDILKKVIENDGR